MAKFSYTAVSLAETTLGSSRYRDEASPVPAMYRPSLEYTVRENEPGTNRNCIVKSIFPLAIQVDGSWKAVSRFVMQTTFTALQSVTNDAERAAIFDSHIAFLTENRDKILKGFAK